MMDSFEPIVKLSPALEDLSTWTTLPEHHTVYFNQLCATTSPLYGVLSHIQKPLDIVSLVVSFPVFSPPCVLFGGLKCDHVELQSFLEHSIKHNKGSPILTCVVPDTSLSMYYILEHVPDVLHALYQVKLTTSTPPGHYGDYASVMNQRSRASCRSQNRYACKRKYIILFYYPDSVRVEICCERPSEHSKDLVPQHSFNLCRNFGYSFVPYYLNVEKKFGVYPKSTLGSLAHPISYHDSIAVTILPGTTNL